MNRSMMEMTDVLNREFDELVKYCMISGEFDSEFYKKYDVKRGLRDKNGKGVLAGLTEISDVVSYEIKNGEKVPADGNLYYQGYNVYELLRNSDNQRYLFEETTYLLLFGELPNKKQMESFLEILSSLQELTGQFVRDVILKAPSRNIMNALQKSVITLYSYDEYPDSIEVSNVLRQSLQLIGKLPLIAVYAYYAYRHIEEGHSLLIRTPKKEYSTAENILYMLHKDGKFTPLEARVLDIALVLHAEHGGGNNSTFTNHVVTSSGTDTYSAVCAAISSLKGPRHGGANMKVQQMFDDIKANISDWENESKIRCYLIEILDKRRFDGSGLIYGLGHAVYTVSDPREVILKAIPHISIPSKQNMKKHPAETPSEQRNIQLFTQRHTKSDRRRKSVSQIEIRQCEHDILFSGLFFQTSVSSPAIMKDIFHYRKYMFNFTAYR